jgi:hypothetical protein
MRNLILCCLFVLAAALLAGCPTVLQKTTATLDGITIATRDTRVVYKKLVGERLDTIATTERDARTSALAKGGCPLDPAAKQPTAECEKIVADAKASYEGRKGRVVAAATKLDAAVATVGAALLLAVDILIMVRDGKKDLWPKLTALAADCVLAGKALLAAWTDFKQASY